MSVCSLEIVYFTYNLFIQAYNCSVQSMAFVQNKHHVDNLTLTCVILTKVIFVIVSSIVKMHNKYNILLSNSVSTLLVF